MIGDFRGASPRIGKDVYIAPTASVIGDVVLGDRSSVWHGASVRGDVWKILIGEYSNIQDCCVCHVTTGGPQLIVGNFVTVGHGAVLHSCTIEEGSLIGMGAVILDGAIVGKGSIIAANSVLLEGTRIPPGSLVAGVPGTVRKRLDDSVAGKLKAQAREYHTLAMTYIAEGGLPDRE